MHMLLKLHAYAPVAMTLFLAQKQLLVLLAEQQPVPVQAVTAVITYHECLSAVKNLISGIPKAVPSCSISKCLM